MGERKGDRGEEVYLDKGPNISPLQKCKHFVSLHSSSLFPPASSSLPSSLLPSFSLFSLFFSYGFLLGAILVLMGKGILQMLAS